MKSIAIILSILLFIVLTFVASENFYEKETVDLKVRSLIENQNTNLSDNTIPSCTCKEKNKDTIEIKKKNKKYKMKARKNKVVVNSFPDDGYL